MVEIIRGFPDIQKEIDPKHVVALGRCIKLSSATYRLLFFHSQTSYDLTKTHSQKLWMSFSAAGGASRSRTTV